MYKYFCILLYFRFLKLYGLDRYCFYKNRNTNENLINNWKPQRENIINEISLRHQMTLMNTVKTYYA